MLLGCIYALDTGIGLLGKGCFEGGCAVNNKGLLGGKVVGIVSVVAFMRRIAFGFCLLVGVPVCASPEILEERSFRDYLHGEIEDEVGSIDDDAILEEAWRERRRWLEKTRERCQPLVARYSFLGGLYAYLLTERHMVDLLLAGTLRAHDLQEHYAYHELFDHRGVEHRHRRIYFGVFVWGLWSRPKLRRLEIAHDPMSLLTMKNTDRSYVLLRLKEQNRTFGELYLYLDNEAQWTEQTEEQRTLIGELERRGVTVVPKYWGSATH